MKLYKIFVIQLCLDFFQNIHGNEMYITDKNGNSIDKIGGKLNNSCIKKIRENFKSSEKITFYKNIDTSDVTDLSYMFDGFKKLDSVCGLMGFNTSNVTNMSFMFNKCINLKFVIFPLNTSEVTDMSYMFYGCKNLNTLAFYKKANTEKVTNMSYMFAGCENLKNLNLENLNTTNVTNISHMFSDCIRITLNSFNTLKLNN